MPIVETVMSALVARYGQSEGTRIYYAMEGEGKGPFGPNGKYRSLHEDFVTRHNLPGTEGTKKPRTRGPGAVRTPRKGGKSTRRR